MEGNVPRYLMGSSSDGGGYNPFSAGTKRYGFGRSNPTMGPVDRTGYINRDAALKARRNAILKQLASSQPGQYLQPGAIK